MQENGLTDGARVNRPSQLGLGYVALRACTPASIAPWYCWTARPTSLAPQRECRIECRSGCRGRAGCKARSSGRKTTVSDVRRVVFDKLPVSHDADELSAIELFEARSFMTRKLWPPDPPSKTYDARTPTRLTWPQPWARVESDSTVGPPYAGSCIRWSASLLLPGLGIRKWALGETLSAAFAAPLVEHRLLQGVCNLARRLSNVETCFGVVLPRGCGTGCVFSLPWADATRCKQTWHVCRLPQIVKAVALHAVAVHVWLRLLQWRLR